MLSALNNEVEQLYNQIFEQGIRSLAVCASQPEEGATTVSVLLAQRCLLMGKKTLLVDLNVHKPSFLPLLNFNTIEQEKIFPLVTDKIETTLFSDPLLVQIQDIALMGITAPKRKDKILKLRSGNILKNQIKQWAEDFDCVIIDTTALNRVNQNNIPADYVAKVCDGAILVVKAGKTTSELINESITQLNKLNVNLLGSVINDHKNPPLKKELLRELYAFKYFPCWLSQYLAKKIQNNNLLNLNI